jgi:hypothetical protein
MKRLSLRAAQRCETACKPTCRCRCGGALHGAKRSEDAEFFQTLPEDDPHHALPKGTRKKRVKVDVVDRPGSLFAEALDAD